MAQLDQAAPLAGRRAMDAVLSRLVGAKPEDVADIVAPLSAGQRAELAVFCYRRAHLHKIGLAVAATCELADLIEAAPSNAAGHVLFTQSRARPAPARASGPRARITLASSASGNSALAEIIASVASEEELDAADAAPLDSPDMQVA